MNLLSPTPVAAAPLATFAALAAEAPTWTNREVIEFCVKCGVSALAAIIGLLAAGMWALLRYLHAKRERDLERERRSFEERLKAKCEELDKLKEERFPHKAEFEELRHRLEEAEAHAEELENGLAQAEESAAKPGQLVRELRGSLGRLREELSDYDRKIRATASRVRRALQLEGLIWEEKVLRSAPGFRPLADRGTPAVAVLNLKGGVGKTTVTANLGTVFARLGYRVLLLDLDLQGSLTGLFLPEDLQQSLYQGRALIQNFFERASEDAAANLLEYCQPVLGGKSGLVPTADTLAYTELNLTFKWLLRIGKRDPRFLLRKTLQLKRVTKRYDLVLLDCPPLMNVSCVNALAVADYVLIPVMASRQVTARVPPLLKMLKSFRENMNPALKVLGVLANRTLRSELTADEMNRWGALRDQCKDQWGEPVPMCQTTIRQSAEIREVEDKRRPLQEGDEMYPVFVKLAEELERRLPTACVPAARRKLAGGVKP
jgi:cellulose biosynthesis protein BcsQ